LPVDNITIKLQEGLSYLESIPDNSIDLILTDPPYITSRETGMDKWADHVKKIDESGENIKTEQEWNEWLKNTTVDISSQKKDKLRENFLKYGSIYGKKYAVKTDYGKWDSEFTMEKLELFIKHFYRVLRKGGTAIIFFDIWKLSYLKEMMDKASFKQPRFIEWIKTNPQPLNSKRNYLTNCREIAILGVKGGKPTFNSSYDNAIYKFPIQGGSKDERFHPTQKSLRLFEELIKKHSNEGDVVLDCFLGSGTTAIASLRTGRKFVGCEIDNEFYEKTMKRIKNHEEKL
tara:strand:- start:333 stop:1196 length:864 start_codon:yes stop_codon:yes gene_type:complete